MFVKYEEQHWNGAGGGGEWTFEVPIRDKTTASMI